MSSLTRFLFANWPLKLTALGLAVVLYMGVAISESTRSWTGPVPIEVLNAPSGAARGAPATPPACGEAPSRSNKTAAPAPRSAGPGWHARTGLGGEGKGRWPMPGGST